MPESTKTLADEPADSSESLVYRIASIEMYTGALLVVLGLVPMLARKLGFDFDLRGTLALLPFSVFMVAGCMIVSGSALRRIPSNPIIAHIPLILALGLLAVTIIS